MSNSNLVTYTNLSPSRYHPRGHKLDTITIHCFVGQVTAKRGCEVFADPNRKASCNYVVGKDGDIGLCVNEEDGSWCTNSESNDRRAVTIEVACDPAYPYAVTASAYNALIDLVTDICRRNGIPKLVWSSDKKDRMNHRNGCNMTVHRDYANKSCPGEYLYSHHGDIASKVNARLAQVPDTVTTSNEPHWAHDDTGWWYEYPDGSCVRNQWQYIDGYWYYFLSSGYIASGWLELDGVWFYMDESGHMLTGWNYIGSNWFYMDESGHMLTGWKEIDNDWWYFNDAGHCRGKFELKY